MYLIGVTDVERYVYTLPLHSTVRESLFDFLNGGYLGSGNIINVVYSLITKHNRMNSAVYVDTGLVSEDYLVTYIISVPTGKGNSLLPLEREPFNTSFDRALMNFTSDRSDVDVFSLKRALLMLGVKLNVLLANMTGTIKLDYLTMEIRLVDGRFIECEII